MNNNSLNPLEGQTFYPNYQLSIDLKLEENTLKTWSNIFGFNVVGVQTYAVGGRIPAVFVVPGQNKLHICTAINDRNNCWNSREYTVGEWFNLKIQEYISKYADVQVPHSVLYSVLHSVLHWFYASTI